MKKIVLIALPVYNEEEQLEKSVVALSNFIKNQTQYDWKIFIADNASTDNTSEIARRLAEQNEHVNYVRISEKGRGRALRKIWSEFEYDIGCYMDIDLSTNLDALPKLIETTDSGPADITIGSRLIPDARVKRNFKREIISRIYNRIIHIMFNPSFKDAQCGFKAIRYSTAKKLLPLIENTNWFFDTELLLLADHYKYAIFEIPVEWIDDLGTTVNIFKTAIEDMRGLKRMKKKFKKESKVKKRNY